MGRFTVENLTRLLVQSAAELSSKQGWMWNIVFVSRRTWIIIKTKPIQATWWTLNLSLWFSPSGVQSVPVKNIWLSNVNICVHMCLNLCILGLFPKGSLDYALTSEGQSGQWYWGGHFMWTGSCGSHFSHFEVSVVPVAETMKHCSRRCFTSLPFVFTLFNPKHVQLR